MIIGGAKLSIRTPPVNERLCRDVHPAEVLTPDGTVIKGARVFATTHRLLVWQAAGRNVEQTVNIALAEPGSVPANRGGLNGGRLECATKDGTFWVNQGRGCGCGSPLKALGAPVSWSG